MMYFVICNLLEFEKKNEKKCDASGKNIMIIENLCNTH